MSDFVDLDRILQTTAPNALDHVRPWVEDQWAAQEALNEFYAKLGMKPPKHVWAKSPRVIHEAIEMLRRIHAGQRHNAIEALVPYNEDTLFRESQKTLLEAIIDKDLTVTMGASLSRQFPYRKPWDLGRLPGFLEHALQPQNLGRHTAPAGWSDVCLYSAGLSSVTLQTQTFCVLPYKALAWMCSPGQKTESADATVWAWADGYTVVIPNEDSRDDEDKEIEAPKNPLLEQINKKLLEGSHE